MGEAWKYYLEMLFCFQTEINPNRVREKCIKRFSLGPNAKRGNQGCTAEGKKTGWSEGKMYKEIMLFGFPL